MRVLCHHSHLLVQKQSMKGDRAGVNLPVASGVKYSGAVILILIPVIVYANKLCFWTHLVIHLPYTVQ